MNLALVKNDPNLIPYAQLIENRYLKAIEVELQLAAGHFSLANFANGHKYFGLHRHKDGWVFREWAPAAKKIYLIGDFSEWKEKETFRLYPLENGIWELWIDLRLLVHGQHYKLMIHSSTDKFERIPAWATRVVQNEETKVFAAQVWDLQNDFNYKVKTFTPKLTPLLIYECHIGMATEDEKVGTYNEFRINILPKIAALGYNAIQLMGIQEHPYYGSFGYHVSSFFAPSSRFGTPEELKELIDSAHKLGIAVVMDIVHSHAIKNDAEGLGKFDGTADQYFYQDEKREHPAWDSLCFSYGKKEVLHFLLSNCKYWIDEFNFDGFRFDGVTSMLYYSHGLNEHFSSYADYFSNNQDVDAAIYLILANKLIHQLKPQAITIAEEMSGMPGIASRIEDGGFGFDYRLAMGIPDYWIKLISKYKDEDWNPGHILWELTNRRSDEKTISYTESHDQALVGDKTIIFRLIDQEMYSHMQVNDNHMSVDRGIALHKMIRLITLSTINGGYLNFMGNEFGHPEWIDFPREGNGWSYKYARRQWSLSENPNLKYHLLMDFDSAMLALVTIKKDFINKPIVKLSDNRKDQVIAFCREPLVFVFNFNPKKSFTDYGIPAAKGIYKTILNSDSKQFGGYGFNEDEQEHATHYDPNLTGKNMEWLKIYIPARSACILEKINPHS